MNNIIQCNIIISFFFFLNLLLFVFQHTFTVMYKWIVHTIINIKVYLYCTYYKITVNILLFFL